MYVRMYVAMYIYYDIHPILTAQSSGTGHCLGSTHVLLTVSINWPDGHPQPGIHCAMHRRPGLKQVAGQLLHS